MDAALIGRLFLYNPETGELTRRTTMKPVYLEKKHTGAVYATLNGRKINARRAVIAIQTGRWPDPHEYRFVGGDPLDLRWCNFFRRVNGDHRYCLECCQMKHQDEFPMKRGKYHDNYSSYCKVCSSERAKVSSRKSILRRYSLTPDQYDAQLAKQGGTCAICNSVNSNIALAVDHCHTSGETRELLCRRCSTGLGAFDDSPRRLLEAARYLLRH